MRSDDAASAAGYPRVRLVGVPCGALTAAARAAIADPRNDVFVSAVTGWEIAVKKAKGCMKAPDNPGGDGRRQGLRALAVDLPSR